MVLCSLFLMSPTLSNLLRSSRQIPVWFEVTAEQGLDPSFSTEELHDLTLLRLSLLTTTRTCREKWEKPVSFKVPRRIHWDKATTRKFFKAHGRKCTAAFGLWVVFWTWELTHSPPSMNCFFLTNSAPTWCPKPLLSHVPMFGADQWIHIHASF